MVQKKILLVDDEPNILEMVSYLLAPLNAVIATSTDGLDALKKLNENAYDLIITDLRMAGVSGLELIACTKISKLNRQAKIIVLSGDIISNLKVLEDLRIVYTLEKLKLTSQLPDFVKKVLSDEKSSKRSHAVGYHESFVDRILVATKELFNFYFETQNVIYSSPFIKKGPM